MKKITLNLPTSIKDIKSFLKEKNDKRYQHNKEVVTQMYKTIIKNIKSNYWNNDVSDYFKKNFEYLDYNGNGTKGLLEKTLKELK